MNKQTCLIVVASMMLALSVSFSVSFSALAQEKKKSKKDVYTFGGTNIVGIQEAAKSLVLVPWKNKIDWSELRYRSAAKRNPISAINEDLITKDIDRSPANDE